MILKSFAIVLTMLLSSWQALSDQYRFTDFGYMYDDFDISLENFLPHDRMSIEELFAIADDHPYYDSFLEELFRRSPVFSENFILMHGTGSLQKASLENPRVIVFGHGYFMSFATAPDAKKAIEIIEFKPDYTFHFHEIVFTDRVEITKESDTCKGCHGSEPLPIWSPYDYWPNVYGSHISRFGTVKERDYYNRLTSRDDGIFKYLRFSRISQNYNQIVEAFNQYTYGMGMLAMSVGLRAYQKQLDPYIYGIMGALEGCFNYTSSASTIEGLKSFFPHSLHSTIDSEFGKYVLTTAQARRDLKDYLVAIYNKKFAGSPLLFNINHDRLLSENNPIAVIRFLLELNGIYLETFMMSQGQNPYYLGVPSNFRKDLLGALFSYNNELIRQLNPTIRDVFGLSWPFFRCDQLRSASLNATQYEPIPDSFGTGGRPKNRSPLGVCIECHAKTRRAPRIPFDDTMALRGWLKSGGLHKVNDRLSRVGAGAMPPDNSLLESERANLKHIFKRLVD